MKCICGYEHKEEWDSETRKFVRTIGDDEFIEIIGEFNKEVDSNYGGTHKISVSLYACPKCFTVRIYD